MVWKAESWLIREVALKDNWNRGKKRNQSWRLIDRELWFSHCYTYPHWVSSGVYAQTVVRAKKKALISSFVSELSKLFRCELFNFYAAQFVNNETSIDRNIEWSHGTKSLIMQLAWFNLVFIDTTLLHGCIGSKISYQTAAFSLLCHLSCWSKITQVTASFYESDDSLQNFFAVRNDEPFRQEKSIVAVVSIAAHLESVGDRDVVLTICVVNAYAGCSIWKKGFFVNSNQNRDKKLT